MPQPTPDIDALPKLHGPNRAESLFPPLLVGLASLLLALGFIHLGSEMVEGDTLSVDRHILQIAQALRMAHPWIAGAMRDLSGLGSTVVLTLFTASTVGYLALVSKRTMALLVAVSVATGSVLVSTFKLGFGRLRPDSVFSDYVASGFGTRLSERPRQHVCDRVFDAGRSRGEQARAMVRRRIHPGGLDRPDLAGGRQSHPARGALGFGCGRWKGLRHRVGHGVAAPGPSHGS